MKFVRFVLSLVLFFVAFRVAVHKSGLSQLWPRGTGPAPFGNNAAAHERGVDALDAKMNAYVDFNNRIVEWQHFDKEIADTRDENQAVLKTHNKVSRIYTPSPAITADEVESLRKAVAMPGSLPQVDPQANAMLGAISALQPTEESLSTYSSSKEYLSDGGAKARQLLPTVLKQLAATAQAEGAFAHAISQVKLKQDEAVLGTLDKGSLHYLTLHDSLLARKLLGGVTELHGRAEAQHIDQVLPQLVAANKALGDYQGAPEALGDMGRKQYKEQMDKLIGNARLLSAALKRDRQPSTSDKTMLDSRLMVANMTGSAEDDDPPTIVEAALVKSYNDSVDKLNMFSR